MGWAVIALGLAISTVGWAEAGFVYTFHFDPLDVTIFPSPIGVNLHYDAATFSFTTDHLLTSENDDQVTLSPPRDLNGFPVTGVYFFRDGERPQLPVYDFSSLTTNIHQPVGAVGSFIVNVDNADHVGTYASDYFARGIVVITDHAIHHLPSTGTLTIAAVPEPSSLTLLGLAGVIGLAIVRRHQTT
jgi:hypothetical protein